MLIILVRSLLKFLEHRKRVNFNIWGVVIHHCLILFSLLFSDLQSELAACPLKYVGFAESSKSLWGEWK